MEQKGARRVMWRSRVPSMYMCRDYTEIHHTCDAGLDIMDGGKGKARIGDESNDLFINGKKIIIYVRECGSHMIAIYTSLCPCRAAGVASFIMHSTNVMLLRFMCNLYTTGLMCSIPYSQKY